MREDMDKVIVERPRRGGGVQGDGRAFRNSRERGSHLGMKRGYDHPKGLNENLQPLRRWLHKQVHRPWDKVWSELCQGIDRRSTVQAHIFLHIDDFVVRDAVMHGGEVLVRSRWWAGSDRVPLREAPHVELFVHPATGILLPNRYRRGAAQRRKAEREAKVAAAAQGVVKPYAPYHAIDAVTQWHRIDGCWWEVTLARVPEARRLEPAPRCYDVLRRCLVTRRGCEPPAFGTTDTMAMYGRPNVYAECMRKLGRAEVRSRLDERG